MYSSNLEKTTSLNLSKLCGKRKIVGSNEIVSKRARFSSSFQRQSFPFHNSIMRYITMNPKSPKVYEKLIQSCKYFFIKNQILVIPELTYDKGKWDNKPLHYPIFLNGKIIHKAKKIFNLNNISSKLWITDCLEIYSDFDLDADLEYDMISFLIPKIYQCIVKKIYLENQIFMYDELLLISKNIEEVNLQEVILIQSDESVAPLEKVFEAFPQIKGFYYTCTECIVPTITAKTFKKLIKIPHFSKPDYFNLAGIPETFDINSFYAYMKKNTFTRFYLEFSDAISEAYKSRLETIIDEINEAEKHDYRTPLFTFHGHDETKFCIMEGLFTRFFR